MARAATPATPVVAETTGPPVTPMMQQYNQAKLEAGDAILFFRLGDFYEMFDADALVAAELLDITLTSREAGLGGRIPMCGVPFHSADGYVAKLLAAGRRVAICEQVEDPKDAKGLVRRAIVRVVSPGTVADPAMLDEKRNNYLVAIAASSGGCGIAFVDVSTGQFGTTQLAGAGAVEAAVAELVRLRPVEVLIPDGAKGEAAVVEAYREHATPVVTRFAREAFSPHAARRAISEHFGVATLEGFGCEHLPLAVAAAGAALRYVRETQRVSATPMSSLSTYDVGSYLVIDAWSRRNLELTQTMRDGARKGSLIWVLDRTRTAMGGRCLRRWVEQPLLQPAQILERQAKVAELHGDAQLSGELSELLAGMGDLERLTARCVFGNANARDLLSVAGALLRFAALSAAVATRGAASLAPSTSGLLAGVDDLHELSQRVAASLRAEPPFSVREGGMIASGVSAELDDLREARDGGKAWVAEFEQRERERTGIKSLKVAFNQVFGYYIEVTKANMAAVPIDYTRKQTLASAERYITPELKVREELILGADARIADLEFELFQVFRAEVAEAAPALQAVAGCIGALDALVSLAEVARENGYVRPVVDDADRIAIDDGRHPVVEAMLHTGTFVPNSCGLSRDESFIIITGPNMAGKSTYIRQVALIVLMAQIGGFVPASRAEIGVVDRIFTRVGASDDLATGRSTFMVELSEVANILNHATPRSLVILDEIGRGTSTFDGLSIAWAVTEYIHNPDHIGAKTLFATHYHELTELEKVLAGVRNFSVAVRQVGEDVVFLRKIVRGGAGRSFGIEVAKLAGLPREVVARAREILANLEQTDDLERKQAKRGKRTVGPPAAQLGLFGETVPGGHELREAAERLARVDIDSLTPVQALVRLEEAVLRARAILHAWEPATAPLATPESRGEDDDLG